jgi:hypothetical protein
VDVTSPPGAAVPAGRLREALAAALAADRPAFLSVVQAADGPGDLTAGVQAGALTVGTHLVRTEARTHRFAVRRAVANPAIPRLTALLRSAHRALARLEARRAAPCLHCGGTGWLAGPRGRPRGGKRRAAGARHGRTERAVCPHCRGSGHRWQVSDLALSRRRREVVALRRRLAREPAFVYHDVTEEWPYTVQHYEKTGELRLRVELAAADGAAVGEPFEVAPSARYTDRVTVNANPGVGVRSDGLSLPTDRRVREALIGAACDEAARGILAAAVRARLAAARARGDRLGREGKPADALEARVDAALLTEALWPAEGERMLAALEHAPR